MLVYRVAHSEIMDPNTGDRYPIGPYRARTQARLEPDVRERLTEMAWRHTDDGHPSPTQDGIKFFPSDHLCAFPGNDALRDWFAGYLDLLYRGHFRVFAYDVPKRSVFQGHVQVVFNPRDALLRGSWAIWTKVPAMTAKWARCPT